jgi:hypothetical protein
MVVSRSLLTFPPRKKDGKQREEICSETWFRFAVSASSETQFRFLRKLFWLAPSPSKSVLADIVTAVPGTTDRGTGNDILDAILHCRNENVPAFPSPERRSRNEERCVVPVPGD